MSFRSSPLVSVITPVYNGEKYLGRCIESVLAQTYTNWEYVIVNNCSSDGTLEIATGYARRDSRVRVVSNSEFVGVTENHNVAFRRISQGSRYCKVVSADDYLFRECIERLVQAAERSPRIDIVGSYAINCEGIRWIGLPPDESVFEGRAICRLYLLGGLAPFGTPSTVLYRSRLVRSRDPFFPGPLPNADLAACLIALQDADFAFVHQILSFEQLHSNAVSARLSGLNAPFLDRIQFLQEYGPTYLNEREMKGRREELLRELYRNLAVNLINLEGRQFWDYQRRRLEPLGCSIYGARMAAAVCAKLADLLANPKQTLEKILRHRGVR